MPEPSVAVVSYAMPVTLTFESGARTSPADGVWITTTTPRGGGTHVGAPGVAVGVACCADATVTIEAIARTSAASPRASMRGAANLLKCQLDFTLRPPRTAVPGG